MKEDLVDTLIFCGAILVILVLVFFGQEDNMLYIIKDIIFIGVSIYIGMLIERIKRELRDLNDIDYEDDDKEDRRK